LETRFSPAIFSPAVNECYIAEYSPGSISALPCSHQLKISDDLG